MTIGICTLVTKKNCFYFKNISKIKKNRLIKWFKFKNINYIDLNSLAKEKGISNPTFSDLPAIDYAFKNEMVDKVVIISNDYTLPFMYCSKNLDLVIAQGINARTVTLTVNHNNSNVLILKSNKYSGKIKSLTNSYLNAKFEGGRHVCRLKLMKEGLE